MQQCHNVLKALAGSTWGCDIETLLTTYQTIGCSILSNCCPVWTPSLKDTNWSRLQHMQNLALRIATVCPRMADVTELHQEAIVCHLPQHPCHQLCRRPPDDRRPSAASTMMRSEQPLKAAHQNCLMADRRPLLQPNRHC